MTTTLKFLLLFAVSSVYSQNESLLLDVSKIEKPTYTYFGLTVDAPDPNHIYTIDAIEKRPEFPGEELALKAFIKENFKTPIENGKKVTGTIFASFIIEKDGSVSEIGILHDYGYGSGEEAIRVLEKMPKWIAGKNDSSAVRCMYSMPIVCDGD
jgi:hypothetical protein